MDKLFEPFYTTKNGGMGVGPSISRCIIESHRGRLWASPNEGPGATFRFSILRSPEVLTSIDGDGATATDTGTHAVTDAVDSMRSR